MAVMNTKSGERQEAGSVPAEIYISLVTSLYSDSRTLFIGSFATTTAALVTGWAAGEPWLLACALAIAVVACARVADMRAFGRLDAPVQRVDDRVVPHGVFGHPQVAAFGPTRAQLEAAGTEFVCYTQRFSDVAQGWALEDEHGLLTVAAGDNVMRVLPPLIVEEAHITEFVERLSEAARQYQVPQAA